MLTSNTHAAPCASQPFTHQLALHLHRYLTPWFTEQRPKRVWVTVGFAHTDAPELTYRITSTGAELTKVDWTYTALIDLHNGNADKAAKPLTAPEPGVHQLALLRIGDGSQNDHALPDGPLGFLLMEATSLQHLESPALDELQGRTREAIQAARRNSIRLTLEETAAHQATSIKEVLYTLFNHLPEWLGVDHAASIMITHGVRDMVRLGRDVTHAPEYDIMAERLFLGDTTLERFVGMTLPVEDKSLLHCALNTQSLDPQRRYHRFVPTQTDHTAWTAIDSAGQPLHVPQRPLKRPPEGRVILVPLATREPGGTSHELLGWLRLSWRRNAHLPASTGPILRQLADALAARLRASELYTLSARQLLLLEELRNDLSQALTTDPGPDASKLDTFVGHVVERVARGTGLPSFSIGRVIGSGSERQLRFVHPHGWSHRDQLELPIAHPNPSQGGVVALAVRLGQPVVLTGGGQTETNKEWHNTILVHEPTGRMTDRRRERVPDNTGWRKLSDYYRSAHDGTYATLAFPIMLGSEALGVIAVEVERSTTWLWWSGLSSQLFYRLLAAELAFSFTILGDIG